ncbi:MAG: hypothetical protein MJK04_24455, partial [Psychrosphaera sp.]|nr:hypothetical protein [Psychrosphaera sp.]
MKLGSMPKFALFIVLMIGNITPSSIIKHDGPNGSFTHTKWTFGINDAFAGKFGGDHETTAPHLEEDPLGEWKYDQQWETYEVDEGGDIGGGTSGSGSGDSSTTTVTLDPTKSKAACTFVAKSNFNTCIAWAAGTALVGGPACLALILPPAVAGCEFGVAAGTIINIYQCNQIATDSALY